MSQDNLLKWYNLMEIDFLITTEEKISHKIESLADKIDYARSIAEKASSIEELRAALENFELCELKFGAKNLVFADGQVDAKIMLIGEAPGATEDEQGIPFCGMSGKLLDTSLSSIGLSRSKNFYITNTVFWRPPNNRQPSAEEVEICRPFLEKHIALINPQIIVMVGGVALTTLFGKNAQTSSFRRKLHMYSNPYIQNVPTTAIFHPAYLLRQPFKKKDTWFDLLHLQNILRTKNILN